MADTASTEAGGGTLEQQLEEMLQIEKFDPPEAFREQALLNDPAVYEEAEQDWKGWWVKQARELHWFKEPTQDLDDSNTLPVGAYVRTQVIGPGNGVLSGVLGTVTETKAGTSNYVVSADYSAVGATTFTVC